MRRAVWLALVAAAAACAKVDTGSDTEPGAIGSGLFVTGILPFAASTFTAMSGDATCVLGSASTGVGYAAIVASDRSATCSDLQQGVARADARSIELVLLRAPASPGGAIDAGTYPVAVPPGAGPASALLAVTQNDARCSPSRVVAMGGSVQVTSVAGGEIRGTVDALLSDGGTIRGAFAAPACAATPGGDLCAGTLAPASPTCSP